MTTILDPTNEQVPVERQLSPRLGEITGRLAMLDISKPRGNILLDSFESMLAERLPNVTHWLTPSARARAASARLLTKPARVRVSSPSFQSGCAW